MSDKNWQWDVLWGVRNAGIYTAEIGHARGNENRLLTAALPFLSYFLIILSTIVLRPAVFQSSAFAALASEVALAISKCLVEATKKGHAGCLGQGNAGGGVIGENHKNAGSRPDCWCDPMH